MKPQKTGIPKLRREAAAIDADSSRPSVESAPAAFPDDTAEIGYAITGDAARVIGKMGSSDAISIIGAIYTAKRAAATEPLEEVPAAPPTPLAPPATPLAAMRLLSWAFALLPGPQGAWLRQQFATFQRLGPEGARLDVLLGLGARGNDSWFAEEKREALNNAICELHRMGQSANIIAEKIRRRSNLRSRPARFSASREDELLKIICEGRPPTSEKQIGRIIMNFNDHRET
jgi:hypothetical protein